MCDSIPFEPWIDTDESAVTLDAEEDINWDRVPTTTLDTHRSFFDTDEFHTFRVTVARPIEQDYRIADDTYTFYKPADELARATWSINNTPWTLDHPPSGSVTATEQINGVFTDAMYDWYDESLRASLHIPSNNNEAHEHIESSDNVSIGFYNVLDDDIDRSGVTAAQRELYIDHIASVDEGRCSDEDGCQVHI